METRDVFCLGYAYPSPSSTLCICIISYPVYMKYLSTFSGIGGFELGINIAYERLRDADRGKDGGGKTYQARDERERLLSEEGEKASPSKRSARKRGHDVSHERPLCIGYSEIDKYASSVYQRYFNHKEYGDITKIDEKTLPDFDLLVGGFPCQAFSIAGKRRGFEDTRGTMFFELARIIKEKRPSYLFFENVKGLLSHDGGATFITILTTLDELGYDCQWQVLNSKNHGVPQNRERVFIIGHLRGAPRPEVFPFGESCEVNNGKDAQGNGDSVAYCLQAGNDKHRGTYINQLNNPTHSNDRVYRTDGLSPTLNTMQGGNRQPFVKVPEATKQGYAVATEGDSINLSVPNSKTRRGRVSDVAQTIDTGMQQHTLTPDCKIRRLTPLECERLQGFPDGWTETGADMEISNTQRYKMCGNAVTVNVIADIMERFLKSV